MPRRRHPQKAIARALDQARKKGFQIVELHSGHVWGKVVAPNLQELTVWSTPRSPETMSRRIREVVRKHEKAQG